MNAEEACKLGLVTEVFPDEHMDQVWPRLHQWAKLPPIAMMRAKGLIRSHLKDKLHEVCCYNFVQGKYYELYGGWQLGITFFYKKYTPLLVNKLHTMIYVTCHVSLHVTFIGSFCHQF